MSESAQPAFRIGGVYRQQDGDLVRLDKAHPKEIGIPACLTGELLTGVYKGYRSGGILQSNGRHIYELDADEYHCHLLPGELHQIDGEWVAKEPEQIVQGFGAIEFPSGSVVMTQGSAITGRIEPEPKRAPLEWNKHSTFDKFHGFVVDCGPAFVVDCGYTHPLQRLADEHDATHGSAFLKAA